MNTALLGSVLRVPLGASAADFAFAGDWRGVLLLGGPAAIACAIRFALLPRVYDLGLERYLSGV